MKNIGDNSLNQKENNQKQISRKIGIVSFTDPRDDVQLVNKREEYIRKSHQTLVKKLEQKGIIVINPLEKRNEENQLVWGVNKENQIKDLQLEFLRENVAGLLFGCWAWNEPNIPIELAKKVDIPIALVTKNNPEWPGITAVTSTGASFWETAHSHHIKTHERFVIQQDQKIDSILNWSNATISLNHLKNGKLVLWGGSPALNMEHLNDDIPFLKRFLVKDIISYDQYILIQKAENILLKNRTRVVKFKNWLESNGCKIEYDNKMTTEEIVLKQIALYFAAKDFITEANKNDESIIGASIKCQPELSVDYGITPCLIPAFLPFPEDSEGKKPIIPTVCEGDIKGLITSILLFGLNGLSPLFGDLKIIKDNYFVIANCGASSAYYAAISNKPKEALAACTIAPQCQGKSGGAFGYITPPTKEEATFARLIRLDSNYILQIGTGKILDFTLKQEKTWGTTWPHTAIQMKIPGELLVKAIGTNHLSLTLGDHREELKFIAKMLGIPIVSLDDINDTQIFLDTI